MVIDVLNEKKLDDRSLRNFLIEVPSHLSDYYHFDIITVKAHSFDEASEICKDTFGFEPEFYGRYDVGHFIYADGVPF